MTGRNYSHTRRDSLPPTPPNDFTATQTDDILGHIEDVANSAAKGFIVADAAGRLAIPIDQIQVRDSCLQLDISAHFIYKGTDPSVDGSWVNVSGGGGGSSQPLWMQPNPYVPPLSTSFSGTGSINDLTGACQIGGPNRMNYLRTPWVGSPFSRQINMVMSNSLIGVDTRQGLVLENASSDFIFFGVCVPTGGTSMVLRVEKLSRETGIVSAQLGADLGPLHRIHGPICLGANIGADHSIQFTYGLGDGQIFAPFDFTAADLGETFEGGVGMLVTSSDSASQPYNLMDVLHWTIDA